MNPNEQGRAARRRQRNLTAALGVLALVLLSLATFETYGDLRVGRDREAELRREIAASEARVEALEDRVTRLREDPAMIERLAREELLMARPDEIVIVLPPDEAPAGEAGGELGVAAASGRREP